VSLQTPCANASRLEASQPGRRMDNPAQESLDQEIQLLLGAWVLQKAASDCRHWREVGMPAVRIAVNLSPPELRRRNAGQKIFDGIGRDLLGDPDWGIDIEVTEGALVGDASGCIDTLIMSGARAASKASR
jgi:EAL domain-containing protein (putative c-di-GMP-specific phosphodiesterase class I)